MHLSSFASTEPLTQERTPQGARALRRVVLKIGTRTLTEGTDRLSPERFHDIAREVVAAAGSETVIVSSGAVAAGFRSLGLVSPPLRIEERQAAAAIGQTRLMGLWSDAFAAVGKTVAQVLLTNDCLTDRRRYVTSRRTLAALLERGIVPIVNENDTVSVDEIMVGDNDNLAAMTAALVDARLLVLLTDVAGVYSGNPTKDPSARLIPFARDAEELRQHCFAKVSAESRGGMTTKLEAAEKAGLYGIPTVITNGSDPAARAAALAGEPTGTFIAPAAERLSARMHWMSVQRRLLGAVIVDDGAVRAIQQNNSLLPKGVVDVVGHFRRGDLVAVIDRQGVERARGLVRFDAREMVRIRGLHTSEVPDVLGVGMGSVVMRPDRIYVMPEARP